MTIRVRAWHTSMKRMFSPEEMATDQMTLLPTGNFINVSSTSTRLSQIYPLTVMTPLLSTGMYDTKGNEVFESDVIEFEEPVFESDVIRCPVVMYEGCWCAHWDRTEKEGRSDWFPLRDIEEMEVIGNIYENDSSR